MSTKVREMFSGYPGHDTNLTLRELVAISPGVEPPDPEGEGWSARMPGDDPHPDGEPNPYLSILPFKLKLALRENPSHKDRDKIIQALHVWERIEGAKIR